jgi:hypothetical protein
VDERGKHRHAEHAGGNATAATRPLKTGPANGNLRIDRRRGVEGGLGHEIGLGARSGAT